MGSRGDDLMAKKAGDEPLEQCMKKLEEQSARNVHLTEQLQLAEGKLEEYFIKANTLVMETELARIELNQIFNAATDGMWIVDDQFNVVKVNNVLSQFLGKAAGETVKQKCYDLFNGSLCHSDACPMKLILKGRKQVECDIERRSGDQTNYFILTASHYRGLDGGLLGMVESFKDITERKHRLSIIDGLTQIANRRRFDECLNQEWARMAREKTPLSFIICDVDFFKLYNDHYGHLLGDDCLRSVAKAIDQSTRRPSDLAARYGGEEFAVLLPNTDAEGAFFIAESIRMKVQSLMIDHAVSPIHPCVTLSLGVSSVIPDYDNNPQMLLEASDSALYDAKREGRNRVFAKLITVSDEPLKIQKSA
jgi:diguanylate cyclase (GGDEF)-like protein/PAS domain S-box-containing protein